MFNGVKLWIFFNLKCDQNNIIITGTGEKRSPLQDTNPSLGGESTGYNPLSHKAVLASPDW